MPRKINTRERIIQEEFCEETLCDFCGKKSNDKSIDGFVDWEKTADDENSEYKNETTNCWMSDKNGNYYNIIICPNCFQNILIKKDNNNSNNSSVKHIDFLNKKIKDLIEENENIIDENENLVEKISQLELFINKIKKDYYKFYKDFNQLIKHEGNRLKIYDFKPIKP